MRNMILINSKVFLKYVQLMERGDIEDSDSLDWEKSKVALPNRIFPFEFKVENILEFINNYQ